MSSFLAFGQFTVTNTNDAGPGSFRQAVIDANTSGVASTITFNAGINPVLTSGPIAANVDVAISGDVAIHNLILQVLKSIFPKGRPYSMMMRSGAIWALGAC